MKTLRGTLNLLVVGAGSSKGFTVIDDYVLPEALSCPCLPQLNTWVTGEGFFDVVRELQTIETTNGDCDVLTCKVADGQIRLTTDQPDLPILTTVIRFTLPAGLLNPNDLISLDKVVVRVWGRFFVTEEEALHKAQRPGCPDPYFRLRNPWSPHGCDLARCMVTEG